MAGKEDAEALRAAMKGWGTDEGGLIKIIGSKTNFELVCIERAYKEYIKRDLIKDIKDETSRDFEDTLVSLLTFSGATDAGICKKAMKGLGTDEDLLAEVLCTRTGDEIQACAEAYKEEFKSNLVSDVEDEVSGNLGKLFSLLLTTKREREGDLDEDVEALYKAGSGKVGTNEGVFVRLLADSPRAYNEEIYHAYAKKYGKALDAVIRSEMGGHLGHALACLVTPLDIFYANALRKAMAGPGTNDTALIRLIVTQKERHLKAINERYLSDYKISLKAAVTSECSGNYKKLLIEVIENFAEK